MNLERRLFYFAALAWACLACAMPDAGLSLGFVGESRASASAVARVSLAELMALGLGFWAWFRLRPSALAGQMAMAWAGLMALGAVWGFLKGWPLKDVLAEARAGLLAPCLLIFSALVRAGAMAPLRCLGLGAVFLAAWQAALLLAEPTGQSNPNLQLLPAIATEHALFLWLPVGAFVVLLAFKPAPAWIWAGLLWVPLWLTQLRSLWLAVLAAPAAALAWELAKGKGRRAWTAPLRAWGAAALGLALVLAGLEAFHPDSAFQFRFRLYRAAQAAHVVGPLPQSFDPGPRYGALLRMTVAHGGLFMNVNSARVLGEKKAGEVAERIRKQDASHSDRVTMRGEAVSAWKSSPLLGEGLGASMDHRMGGAGSLWRMRDPHHGYAWLLWKLGLLGALGLAFLACRFAPRLGSRPALASALTYWLVLEFFQAGLLWLQGSLVLAAFWALAEEKEAA